MWCKNPTSRGPSQLLCASRWSAKTVRAVIDQFLMPLHFFLNIFFLQFYYKENFIQTKVFQNKVVFDVTKCYE